MTIIKTDMTNKRYQEVEIHCEGEHIELELVSCALVVLKKLRDSFPLAYIKVMCDTEAGIDLLNEIKED